MSTLPTDSEARKEYPLFRGLLRYFPAALAGVARHSKIGNDKHNPGEEMHHARGKSADHGDCILRHMVDLAELEAEIARNPERQLHKVEALLSEASALLWRAAAWSQELHERYGCAPLAPGAKYPDVNRVVQVDTAKGDVPCGGGLKGVVLGGETIYTWQDHGR